MQSLIARFSGLAPREFVAPITPGTDRVVYLAGRTPFVYRVDPGPFGWFKLSPGKRNIAERVAEAEEWEILAYLETVTKHYTLYVIHRLGGATWLCYPYNESDAAQKGMRAEPHQVHLIRESVETFDVIHAAGVPGDLIFTMMRLEDYCIAPPELGTESHIQTGSKEFRTVYRIANQRILDERKKQAQADRHLAFRSIEERMRYHLNFLGAELVDWKTHGNSYVVTWRDEEGDSHQTRVDSQMNVVRAGLCLRGTDRNYNLAAMADLVREAKRRNIFHEEQV